MSSLYLTPTEIWDWSVIHPYTPPELIEEDPEEPNLPHVHIKDLYSDALVPVAGVIGWGTDFVQAFTEIDPPLIFSPPSVFSASGDFGWFWCKRKHQGLVNAKFSVAAATCTITPYLYGYNDIYAILPSFTLTASATQEASLFVAPMTEYNLYGAQKSGIIISNISSGDVTFRLAFV